MKFKGTIDKIEVCNSKNEHSIYINDFFLCDLSDGDFTHERDEIHANLIADAFNTTNDCGMMPSELFERNKELLEVIQKYHDMATRRTMPTETELDILSIESKKVLKR